MTEFNEKLDLVVKRDLAATPDQIWRAWSDPALLEQWWAPKPHKTVVHKLDLTPGGAFNTTMKLDDGSEFSGEGCFLISEKPRRIVWTSAMRGGFRPNGDGFGDVGFFSAEITLEPIEGGTRYTAVARHNKEEQCKAHREMGFVEGWGICIDQLGEVAKTL